MRMADVCIAHGGGCRDGWTSAWLVKKAFPDCEVVLTSYGQPLPDESVYSDRRVVICDFSYPPEQMAVIAAKAKSVVVRDHHVSAIRKWDVELDHGPSMMFFNETWRPNVSMLFDTRKSGAMLVWEWLNPDKKDQPWLAPWLVRLVQDRDLWQWQFPESREISAYIASFPMTAEAWDFLHADLETDAGRKVAGEVGAAILRTNRQHVEAAVKNAVYWRLADGVSVPVLNTTHLHSEVGERLCQGHPFSLTYSDDLKGMKRRWSMRSADGGMDVSKVAECLGGGGHARAAGFERSLDETFSATAWMVGQAYKQVLSGKNTGGE